MKKVKCIIVEYTEKVQQSTNTAEQNRYLAYIRHLTIHHTNTDEEVDEAGVLETYAKLLRAQANLKSILPAE